MKRRGGREGVWIWKKEKEEKGEKKEKVWINVT